MQHTNSSPFVSPVSWQQRAEKLRTMEIRLISAPEFESLTEVSLQKQAPDQLFQEEGQVTIEEERFSLLLTPGGERHLFRKFNFQKASARRLQDRLRRSRSERTVREMERFLCAAQETRSQIVQSNLRLVIALARKHSTSQQEFEDFVSEGNLILVNAVDKFDFSRGFRFSTYATHSVQRHFFRLMQRRQRRKQREKLSPVEVLANVSSQLEETDKWDPRIAQELIQRFDDCLNPRERVILEERFGLVGDSAGTLKSVAEKVGLSKERVRQLQIGAIEKLQDLAVKMRLRPEACL